VELIMNSTDILGAIAIGLFILGLVVASLGN
jgi:hypothetical protein